MRTPRSHRITLVLPSVRMYSADSSNSSSVAARPRFSSTGFFAGPPRFSSEKFCMLRAPIWMQSA